MIPVTLHDIFPEPQSLRLQVQASTQGQTHTLQPTSSRNLNHIPTAPKSHLEKGWYSGVRRVIFLLAKETERRTKKPQTPTQPAARTYDTSILDAAASYRPARRGEKAIDSILD